MKNFYLCSFREQKELSIAEMAKLIGVSKSYYEKIEYGDRNPSFNFIQKFKLAFPNMETDKLMSNTQKV